MRFIGLDVLSERSSGTPVKPVRSTGGVGRIGPLPSEAVQAGRF